MRKFTVTEDCEVVLNGENYILQAGDKISLVENGNGNEFVVTVPNSVKTTYRIVEDTDEFQIHRSDRRNDEKLIAVIREGKITDNRDTPLAVLSPALDWALAQWQNKRWAPRDVIRDARERTSDYEGRPSIV